MASGPLGGGDDSTEKKPCKETKVYTRKAFKRPKTSFNSATAPNASAVAGTVNNDMSESKESGDAAVKPSDQIQGSTGTLADEERGTGQEQELVDSRLEGASEDTSSLNRQEGGGVIGLDRRAALSEVMVPGPDGQVRISLVSRTKSELRELKRKLVSDLDTVRSLVRRIEEHVGRVGGVGNNVSTNGVRRIQLDIAPVGVHRENRPLNQSSVSVVENSQGVGDVVEKEKRTPKANQFYSNSDFLLAKDKFPPAESNKKSKSNGRKQGGGDMAARFTAGSKFFKSCSALLEKLIKHKHGWVFSKPVDVEALNLHDYFDIIKQPMDLGTIKTRLLSNGYKSPKEFAEDVRLTFNNAMTYNPKGHDVHAMAEQLLKIFEDRWAIIESDYDRDMRFATAYEASLPMSTPRSAPPHRPPSLDTRRVLDRSESMTYPTDPRPKPMDVNTSGRTAAPKKPKAKDPHKRDMTYEEKQKLSANLQNLPPEKLDNIVQIIKKRNSALCQHDDEIEVDIDSVDTETLWELDRFVTNYKKSLSKTKRKAELASQARAEAERDTQERNPTPVRQEVPNEDERNLSSLQLDQGKNQVNSASKSSSSSSSSSDSDSSSSDSDSESSSASRSGGS